MLEGVLMERVRQYYRALYPMEEELVRKKAKQTLTACVAAGALAGAFLLLFRVRSVFYILYTAVLISFLCVRILYGMVEREEERILSEFAEFLNRFSAAYLDQKHVQKALEAAGRMQERHLYGHLAIIKKVLDNETQESAREMLCAYIKTAPNKALGEFLMILFLAKEWGDPGEDPLLLRQLETLRTEIQDELIILKQKKYEFTFEIPICLAPFFCLWPIRKWSASLMEGMSAYYEGNYGDTAMLMIFCCVLTCFLLIFYFRFFGKFSTMEHDGQSLFLRIPGVKEFYLRRLYADYAKTLKKEDRLEEAGWGRNLPLYEERRLELAIVLGVFSGVFGALHYRFWPLFALAGMALGVWICECYLALLYAETKRQKKEERMMLERVVDFLKDHPQIKTGQIFYYLEAFSNHYRRELELLYRTFCRRETLRGVIGPVKEDELGFFLQGLEAADRMPLAKAFGGIRVQLEFERQKYVLEKKKWLADTAALSRVLAFLPLFLTVGMYLILPFIAEGLQEIAAYNASFGTYF